MWAEKEMRNLKRLLAAGIPCPEPIEVRENVLVMSFLGDSEGWASPRLKDAQLDNAVCADLYVELVLAVRKLFHQCKLVHADLSEYNILYHDSHLYIIDVSQSVEHDHPSAFDFLRKDVKNIEEYFQRLGVNCLGMRRCFEFITKESLDKQDQESDEACLKRILQDSTGTNDPGFDDLPVQSHEDSVFMKSYIPRTLTEVYDPERDLEKAQASGEKPIYADTIGLAIPSTRISQSQDDKVLGTSEDGDEDDSSEEEAEGEDPTTDDDNFEKKPRGHRHEDKEAKKVHLLLQFFFF
jgi:RIO kinase 1